MDLQGSDRTITVDEPWEDTEEEDAVEFHLFPWPTWSFRSTFSLSGEQPGKQQNGLRDSLVADVKYENPFDLENQYQIKGIRMQEILLSFCERQPIVIEEAGNSNGFKGTLLSSKSPRLLLCYQLQLFFSLFSL